MNQYVVAFCVSAAWDIILRWFSGKLEFMGIEKQMKYNKLLLLFLYVVIGVSVYEYLVHKFVSHGEENIIPKYIPKYMTQYTGINVVSYKHGKHHEAKDPPFGSMQNNENICDLLISTQQSIKLYIGGLITLGGVGLMLGFKKLHLFISLTFAMIYVLVTWNTFHTLAHGALYEEYHNCSYIVPPLPTFAYYNPFRDTFVLYHIRHHENGGKTNFNTTVPYVGDVLFGTLK